MVTIGGGVGALAIASNGACWAVYPAALSCGACLVGFAGLTARTAVFSVVAKVYTCFIALGQGVLTADSTLSLATDFSCFASLTASSTMKTTGL